VLLALKKNIHHFQQVLDLMAWPDYALNILTDKGRRYAKVTDEHVHAPRAGALIR